MATLPTPEQSAREILSIFVDHFNLRSGKVLDINNFRAVWESRKLSHQDFKPGMEFAISQGWVEVSANGVSYKLTDAGFKEA